MGLRHPLRPGRRLATIPLADRALGTSGSGTQFFVDRGRRLGHILDPRTGLPATGVDDVQTSFSLTLLCPDQTGVLAAVAGVFYGMAFRTGKGIRAAMVTHALTVTTWKTFFS